MAAYSSRGPSEKQLAYLVNLLHSRDLNPPLGDLAQVLSQLRNPDEITNVDVYVARFKELPPSRPAEYRQEATWAELRRELRETIDAILARRSRQPWSSADYVEDDPRYEEAAALLQSMKNPVASAPLRLAVEDVDPEQAVEALSFAVMLLAADDPDNALTPEQLQDATSSIEALRKVWELRLEA